MTQRSIEKIFAPPPSHWVGDGFKVHNYFPSWNLSNQRMSPWYMMDYNAPNYMPPGAQRGVSPHPHKGLETVTLSYAGSVAHHDSAGHSGVIHPGDVQWMTAGSGLLHKEYQEESFAKKGGIMHMVQLWANLPAAYKNTPPAYQDITEAQQTTLPFADGSGFAKIIAGELAGAKGPAKHFSPLFLYKLEFTQAGSFSFTVPEDWNTALLAINGEVEIAHKKLPEHHLALCANDGNKVTLKASKYAHILALGGKPLNEPIATYGPFLMNTQEEIRQAFTDFQMGKFGELE